MAFLNYVPESNMSISCSASVGLHIEVVISLSLEVLMPESSLYAVHFRLDMDMQNSIGLPLKSIVTAEC